VLEDCLSGAMGAEPNQRTEGSRNHHLQRCPARFRRGKGFRQGIDAFVDHNATSLPLRGHQYFVAILTPSR
jgi:hypothetical protein